MLLPAYEERQTGRVENVCTISHDGNGNQKATPENQQSTLARTEQITMNILWGLLMAMTGLLMLVAGTAKSEFIIYRRFI